MRKEVFFRVAAALFFVLFLYMGYILFFFSHDDAHAWLAGGFWLAAVIMAFVVLLGP